MNVFHCWPEKFQTFVIVFASYVTEGTFWSKIFWLKSIQEKFISSLSEILLLVLLELHLKCLEVNWNWEKRVKKNFPANAQFFIFSRLWQKFHMKCCYISVPYIHMICLITFFLKIFDIKTNVLEYWPKETSLLSRKLQSPCSEETFIPKILKQVQKANFFWTMGKEAFHWC